LYYQRYSTNFDIPCSLFLAQYSKKYFKKLIFIGKNPPPNPRWRRAVKFYLANFWRKILFFFSKFYQTEYRISNKEFRISKESRFDGTSKFDIPCSKFDIQTELNSPARWRGLGGGLTLPNNLILILLLTFGNALLLNAQTQLTTSEVLASAKNQYVLQLQKQRVNFLQNSDSKLPLVDEIEVRTETNDFRLIEQEYAIRGRFHTRDQQKAQKDLHQAMIELSSIEEQILLHELLSERYFGIVEVLYFEKLLTAKKDQKVLLEDRLLVFQKSINLPKFEITDLIDAEDDLHTAERDILRLENALTNAQQKIFRWSNEIGTLKTEDVPLVGIDEVMELVRNFPNEPSTAHATLVKRNLNSELATREQSLRRAEEENTFEFFQAKIGGTDDDGFRQNFTLGLGIRIPVRDREKINLMELEFEKVDEAARYEEIRLALKDRMAQVKVQIENNYRLYQLLNQQLENSQAAFALNQYQKIAGASPIALLKLKGSQFNKELERFQIEQEIYMLYLELLDASGVIMELPLRNYLLANQPSF